jgi:GntR family transcriptional regulator, rspAB operon transcriptional repressor
MQMVPLALPGATFDRQGPRLADQVFRYLRDQIVRGVLPPDTPLVEVEVAKQLRISRTPVREALIKLAEEELVRIYPQRGSFVAPISLEAVHDAQIIREHLECALMADVAQRITPAWQSLLEENLDKQKHAERRSNGALFYELDESFHAMLGEISGRARVWKMILQAKVHMDRVRYLSHQEPGHIKKLIVQHRDIVGALTRHDAAAATEAMRQHLRMVFSTIRTLGFDQNVRSGPPPRVPKTVESVATQPQKPPEAGRLSRSAKIKA